MFILFVHEHLRSRASELGSRFNLPIFLEGTQPTAKIEQIGSPILVLTENRLEMRLTTKKISTFFIDFHDKELLYRMRHSNRKNEALARAAGLKKNRAPIVFDLTAGLGRDAFVLAGLGCKVHLFEREPVIAALLGDGLERAAQGEFSKTIKRMTLHPGDARDLIARVAQKTPPDVLYLDPMFPHRTKSALVKREMQILQAISGVDRDSGQLFQAAQQYARGRIVCKRPRQAPFLNNAEPSMSITTKKHRFDVYLVQNDLNSKA